MLCSIQCTEESFYFSISKSCVIVTFLIRNVIMIALITIVIFILETDVKM